VIQKPPARPSDATYLERLRTPWWWYLGAIAVAVLLGAEFALAVSGWLSWVPLLILLPACLLVVWRLSSGQVAVVGAELWAGDRKLRLADLDRVIPLTPGELRRLVGRHSDPTAFVFIRSWVGPGLQLVLKRPEDVSGPTDQPIEPSALASEGGAPELPPYWVISTRRPARLIAALEARDASENHSRSV
jgi:hypothetical protein